MSALIRIVQMFPILVLFGVVAFVAYLVISGAKSPTRAKEVLIKAFLWLSSALSVFFALATLYAAIEHNSNVFEFFGALLVLALLMLAITLICRWRFRVNHPHYKQSATRSRTIPQWEKRLRGILSVLEKLGLGSQNPKR